MPDRPPSLAEGYSGEWGTGDHDKLIRCIAALDAGRASFEEQRRKNEDLERKIAVLDSQLRPKPFPWQWAIGIAFVIVGQIIAVVTAINARPTYGDVQRLISEQPNPKLDAAYEGLRRQIDEIQRNLTRLQDRADRAESDIARLGGTPAARRR